MAQLPLPRRTDGRRQLSRRPVIPLQAAVEGGELTLGPLPDSVRQVLRRLAEEGHQAALVGGALRDLLLSGEATDWDVATAAPPEAVVELFPRSTWENRFGTVTVEAEPPVQVTTYRSERGYRDRRRPDKVRWAGSLEDDLARRDFTMNAIAWLPTDLDAGRGRLVDPHDGLADLRAGLLRAVGDPDRRLDEDALRLLRAVRFAIRFRLSIEAGTEAALRRHAAHAASLSGERVRDELLRILAADRPSHAFELMERLGLLSVVLPELAALRGVPQAKPLPGDALDHSLRAMDELPADRPLLRLAGLLHDVGKAVTLADGHFHGHERRGAEIAGALMQRLRFSNADLEAVTGLVRHHMFGYRSDWTDAAVRRFLRRLGATRLDELLALRAADDRASGAGPAAEQNLAELRGRIEAIACGPLQTGDLALDGHRLQRALGLRPGPIIGSLLERLLDRVLEDPSLNEPETLLRLASQLLEEGGADRHRPEQHGADAPEPRG